MYTRWKLYQKKLHVEGENSYCCVGYQVFIEEHDMAGAVEELQSLGNGFFFLFQFRPQFRGIDSWLVACKYLSLQTHKGGVCFISMTEISNPTNLLLQDGKNPEFAPALLPIQLVW